jgi:hypothetical protein
MSKPNTCKDCKHWKNQQSELEYSKFYGICTCFKWKFDTKGAGDVVVLDRQNRTEKHMGVNRFETQNNEVPIGVPNKSRYCFVTDENFGCINYSK